MSPLEQVFVGLYPTHSVLPPFVVRSVQKSGRCLHGGVEPRYYVLEEVGPNMFGLVYRPLPGRQAGGGVSLSTRRDVYEYSIVCSSGNLLRHSIPVCSAVGLVYDDCPAQ